MSILRSHPVRGIVLVCVLSLVSFAAASVAVAVTPAPSLTIHSLASPTHFSSADSEGCLQRGVSSQDPCDVWQVTVTNSGSQPAAGPVVLTDALPAGLSVHGVQFFWAQNPVGLGGGEAGVGSGEGVCEPEAVPVRCEFFGGLAPDQRLEMVIYTTVQPGAVSALNTASVSEAGSPVASVSENDVISSEPPLFAPSAFLSSISGSDGTSDTQAGDHPYEFVTRIDLNTKIAPPPERGSPRATSVDGLRDVVVDLPLGLVGSAVATPRCTFAQLDSNHTVGCPLDTVVGRLRTEPRGTAAGVNNPIYNMVPGHGVAAEFGFKDVLGAAHVIASSVVPTPAGYVLRATAREIPEIVLTNIIATVYGNPAAKNGAGATPAAMFTSSSDCSGEPLATRLYMDSWLHPGSWGADGTPNLSDPNWKEAVSQSPPVTGCDALRFSPEAFSARPDTSVADSPTGLSFDLKVPQSETPGTLATPPLRDASVRLPVGMTINPSAASGLQACSEAQIGWLGPVSATNRGLTNFTAAAPACPEASKVGSVEVETPALAGVLPGSIYLAAQNENPFHSLLAGYIVIDDPVTGAILKIPGELRTDPVTGQITGMFDENPQFPFSDLRLRFFGGARGELATPEGCGMYTTTSDLMPWSAPESGSDATPSSSFPIESGCVTGFAPGFTAGTENPQAGGYSPFSLSLSRTDGDQNLAGITVTLPPGLLGKIAGIPLCSDANANMGTCPEASKVGSVTVGAGVGPDPLFVSGKAFLTGPYNGGPYGLVVQVPAVAGPFDLGMVSVRQALRVDPHTAQVTAVSDPFPTILDGIPLRVRRVDVTLDRPGFTFNPTNCTPMAISGSVTSTAGASASVSSRFQASGCRELAFKPSFKVSTQARTSKKDGASLDVKVGYPQGAQANIRSVAVTLPKALPSRLTTIQQACPEAVFAANPASCPAGSNIGTATAVTPVLASPVVGPAYLVSHGGAAFPDVVIVLQGEGITLDLVGSVNIKKQITSSTFASIPDAPISGFELKLPEGPHSGLAAVVPAKAKGNLCGTSLTMPTTITGQNGAQIKQNTKIQVTGCPKAKKTHKPKHTRRAHGKQHKKK
jgi:hypothetical protein